MKQYVKTMNVFTIIFSLLLLSCVEDSDFKTPNVACNPPEIQANTTLKDLKEMYVFGGKTFEDELIVEAYIASNDFSGNIYKTLFVQNLAENPTAGIKIALDQTSIYTKYPMGRKIYLNLKGLSIDYYFGSLQIGKVYDGEFQGINRNEISNHLLRTCENTAIIPKKINLNLLDENDVGILVKIGNVQFNEAENDKSYANLDNNETVSRQINQFDADCSLLGMIELRNSGFANFKSQLLPSAKGSIIGLLDNYYDDFQLIIRNSEDVEMNDLRCNASSQLSPNFTLKNVVELYNGKTHRFGSSQDIITEAFVISTDEYGNFGKRLVVQDDIENPSAGIQILMDSEEIFQDFAVGDKVILKLNKLYMDIVEGRLSIGFGGNKLNEIAEKEIHNHVINTKENYPITPVEVEINDVKKPENQQILLSIINLQLIQEEVGESFTFDSGNDDGYRTFETCGKTDKISLFTSGDALFANEEIPVGNGKITGIFSGNQLEINKKNDVELTANYEECPEIKYHVMITEVADPENSTTARFVELYNPSNFDVDLDGWKLNKYVNGATSPSSDGLDLMGYTILQKDFLIIANTGFQLIFNKTPDIETSYITGNGDDSYELVDNQGKIIDVYGVVGIDGNDANWEYLDGKAVRKRIISKPNPIFDASEWTIYTEVDNTLTDFPDSKQTVPNDFSPGMR